MIVGSLHVNPPEGSRDAGASIKTPWRKTKGDAKKIAKAFETFASRTKKLVQDNEADIAGRSEIDDKFIK